MTPEEIKEIQRQSFERLGKGLDHGVQIRYSTQDDWMDVLAEVNGTARIQWLDGDGYYYRIRPDTVNVFGMELPLVNSDIRFVEAGSNGVQILFYLDDVEQAEKWRQFIFESVSGKYAQKPKNKVTGTRINQLLQEAFSECSNTYTIGVAQKIIDLFEGKGE